MCTAADPLKEPRPTSAINAAGAAAHRWGWSLNRVDSTSSNAQPSANPSSTTLVKAFSLTGRTGAAMRTAATISQAAMDRATIDPILVLAVGCAPGCWRSPCRVPVAMIASTEQRARGDENPSPLYTKSSVPRQYVAQKAKSLAREPGPSNRTLIGGRDSDSVQHVAAIALIPVPRNTLRSTPLRLSQCGIIWTDIWPQCVKLVRRVALSVGTCARVPVLLNRAGLAVKTAGGGAHCRKQWVCHRSSHLHQLGRWKWLVQECSPRV